MQSTIFDGNSSFYFIGIGGVSMNALAKFTKDLGKTVAGCDAVESEYTEELKNYGINVSVGEVRDSVEEYDAVVYTDAIRETNPQLQQAKKLRKNLIARGQLLAEACSLFKCVTAVSGCHGKTTCTAMLAQVFKAAESKFVSHIGGRDTQLSNYANFGYDHFVTEACEYKKNFLLLKPTLAVILNSDADHLECYGSEEELKNAYLKFAASAQKTVYLYGDLPLNGAVSFGFDDRADYYAKCIKSLGGKYSFTAYEAGKPLGKVCLSVYGKHNVLNAVAAVAAARTLGLPFEAIQKGLEIFKGVERRFETIGTIGGARCIADYAHHPNEIRAALKTANLIAEGELFVVFQPHTYSRTKNLFKQFIKVLSPVKNLLVYKTFAAREYFDDAGSALTLSQALKKSAYANSPDDVIYFLSKAKPNDIILFLGAGDIYTIAKNLIQKYS